MQTQSHSMPVKAPQRPLPRKAEDHSTVSKWKPQQVGLTRQELRDIVIDLIG